MVVGRLLPALNWFGQLLGAAAGAYLDWRIFGRKGAPLEQGKLESMRLQYSTYGVPIPWMWGRMRLAGNVIWIGSIREQRWEEASGKKTPDTIFYRYYANFAVGICRGPIDRVQKIWADGQLIYNLDENNQGVAMIDGLNFRLYLGTETQVADRLIEEAEGLEGDIPAFRGLAYIVFEELPLELFANHIPNMTFEVFTAASEAITIYPIAGTDHGATTLVYSSPGYAVYCNASIWYLINTITGELERRVDWSVEEIPWVLYCFDTDADGRLIYTQKRYEADPTDTVFCVLDGRSFALLYEAHAVEQPPYHHQYIASAICVPQGSRNGFFYAIKATGTTIYAVYKATLRIAWGQVGVDGTESFVSMAADSERGRVWALAHKATVGAEATYIAGIVNVDRHVYKDVSAYFNGTGEIAYDPVTNQVICVTGNDHASDDTHGSVAFFDADVLWSDGAVSDAYLGELDLGTSGAGGFFFSDIHRGVVNGFLWLSRVSDILKINVATRTIDETYSIPTSMSLGGGIYDPLTHSYIQGVGTQYGTDQRVVKIPLDRGAAEGVPLSTIVGDICEETGLLVDSPAEVDVTALTDIVKGFVIADRGEARGSLEQLMAAYFFDAVESDGLIKFPKRGGASVVTIDEDELAAHLAGSERPPLLTTRRAQELEIPYRVEVSYSDYTGDYDTVVQAEERQITESEVVASLSFPLVLDADEAKQIAEKTLALAWTGRTEHEFSIHRKFADLDPADVITVNRGDGSYLLRILEIDNQGGILNVKAAEEETAAYESSAIGSPPPAGNETVAWPGPTELVLLDLPLIDESYAYPGVILAATGVTDYWQGCRVLFSDDGSAFSYWAADLLEATLGHASTALGDVADPNVWDEGNTVTVFLADTGDSLTTATEDEVLNGANLAALGDEVIQFRTATENGDGSWTLSGLLRGRYGSEFATSTHVVGDKFALLDLDTLEYASWAIADQGVQKYVRSVSIGMSSGSIQAFTCHLRSMMPLSPVHVAGTRDGSDNLTITWIRRTRVDGEWQDETDVPLGESSEAYEIDIYDGSAVVRTIEVTDETATYTAAEQTTDGLTPGNPVSLTVYQVSGQIGRGFGTEATV